MAYHKEYLEALLNRVDIVDTIGEFVPLKKKGRDYYGLCPFHKEETPSFTVTETKQFYHCFGCGAYGNAIDFLRSRGYSFYEAVQRLSKRYKFYPRQWRAYKKRRENE